MRLLLVGALAALAVALPTGYHRKPSANERSELHRRAAAPWLNMEKRDACADLLSEAAQKVSRKKRVLYFRSCFAKKCETTDSVEKCARRLVKQKIEDLEFWIDEYSLSYKNHEKLDKKLEL